MNYRDRQSFFVTLAQCLEKGSKILIAGAGFHYKTITALAPEVLDELCEQVVAVKHSGLYIESYGGGCLHFMDLHNASTSADLATDLKSGPAVDYVFLLEQSQGELRKEYNHFVLPSLADSFHGQLVYVYTGPLDESRKGQ